MNPKQNSLPALLGEPAVKCEYQSYLCIDISHIFTTRGRTKFRVTVLQLNFLSESMVTSEVHVLDDLMNTTLSEHEKDIPMHETLFLNTTDCTSLATSDPLKTTKQH